MRRLTLILFLAVFASLSSLLAQTKTITGTVTGSDDGLPIPGVSIVVKGTTTGTITDGNGKYSLSIPEDAQTLVFSFVGMETQEVAVQGRSVIDVSLRSEALDIDEVVVTALGISREKKSLGYSTQKIGGEKVADVKTNNFVNNLSGKVAGVQVKVNGNFGGSTNIVIRGNSSLTGNNQALFVVDGVPMDNSNTNEGAQTQGGSGYDYGSPVSDINPDDIESINVLKGAAATALYGSRAANGVVIVTTKKGNKNSKGIGVTINSSYGFGNIDRSTFAEYQQEYGAGYGPYYSGGAHPGLYEYADLDGDGNADLMVPTTEDASFGEKFDPSLMVYQWNSFIPESPNFQKATPWVAAKNGPDSFFETASTVQNSIAIDGANEVASFRLAYTNLYQTGIFPNSKLKRNNFNFNASYKPIDNLTFAASVNYINTNTLGRNSTGYSNNILSSFRQWWQTNVDVQELKDMYFKTGRNVTWNMNDPAGGDLTPIYWDNFYWDRYENYQNDSRDRILGNLSLNYDITDYLNVLMRASVDNYSMLQEERLAVGSIARRFGIGRPDVGSGYSRYNRNFTENNYDLMLNYNDKFGDFSVSALVGANWRRNFINSIYASTNGGLVVPGLYSLSNSKENVLAPEELDEKIAVDGYYARASVGFKEVVYVDATIRRDRSSTLPEGNNVYYYPSVAGSFIFSNMFDATWFQFGKFRINYAEVGNDAPFARVTDVYSKPAPFGSIPLFSVNSTKNNSNLKPERTKSFETGLEMMFFNKRFGFDFAYYDNKTVNQIIPVSVSRATGYSYKYMNSGEIDNSGFELALNGVPVNNKNFRWDVTLNWARNRNKVVSLFVNPETGEEVQNLVLGSFQGGITINATVGQPYGTIQGTDYVYDDNGNKIVTPRGYYAKTTTSDNVIGDVNPDFTAGLYNSFSIKNLTVGFLLDMQYGGDIFSLDQWYGQGTGLYPESVGLNDLGNPVRNHISEGGGFVLDGVKLDGTQNDVRISGDRYSAYGWARYPNATYVYDASYLKLREATISYNFPMDQSKFVKGITLGVVGSNLWIIWKNLPYADPEAGVSSGNLQGWQSGVMPTVRNFSFNLKMNF
jgi:TonB-linked SusC/RagA family outer membrane protein